MFDGADQNKVNHYRNEQTEQPHLRGRDKVPDDAYWHPAGFY